MQGRWRPILGLAVRAAIIGLMVIGPAIIGAGRAAAQDRPWGGFTAPSAGPAEPIGSYANGCLQGGVALPAEGEGYQVVRLSRNRYYGHPTMIAFLQDMGRRAAAAGLGTVLVADIAMPRGGPFLTGHRSHQTGLDADIWLRLDLPMLARARREDLSSVVVVDRRAQRVDPAIWTRAHGELIRLAAVDPRVDRIFVHPAIKLALCEMRWSDRGFLRTVRPWFGHDSHFHIRLHCPPDGRHDPLPAGEGCGTDLMAWFAPPAAPPTRPAAAPPRPPLPALCQAMLRGGE